MTTHELLLTAWEKDPFVILLCVAALLAYAVRVRGHVGKRAVFFAVAAVVFVLALASPIGVLSRGYLFSAHMMQHLMLVLVVPPLVLLSLPPTGKPGEKRGDASASAGAVSKSIRHPIRFFAPWIAGVGAMWLWHAPTLCNAASQNLSVLRLQTVSLVGMGAAFWWPILGSRVARRLTPFAGMVYLFTACVACTILGVLVTFSPVEVCSVYLHPVDRLGALTLLQEGWGLTPKIDQEIGGLMMWVPGCMVYALSILGMYARYSRDDQPSESDDAQDDHTGDTTADGPATTPTSSTLSKEHS